MFKNTNGLLSLLTRHHLSTVVGGAPLPPPTPRIPSPQNLSQKQKDDLRKVAYYINEKLLQQPRHILHPDAYRKLSPKDDSRLIGHYPYFEAESYQLRDPYLDWDDPFQRRMFDEVLHPDYELFSRFSFDHETRVGPLKMFSFVFIGLGSFFTLYYCLTTYIPNTIIPPMADRELPYTHLYFKDGKIPQSMLKDSHISLK